MSDDPQRSLLAAVSDRIIDSIRALKAIERRKREATPSTREYHRLVEDTEAKSKEIFLAAAEQDLLARRMRPGGPTIEETATSEKRQEESNP